MWLTVAAFLRQLSWRELLARYTRKNRYHLRTILFSTTANAAICGDIIFDVTDDDIGVLF